MGPRVASECILGLEMRPSQGLEPREGPGLDVRQAFYWELRREHQPPLPYIPHKVRWLWDLVIGGRGRLRASSRAVFGDSERAESRR